MFKSQKTPGHGARLTLTVFFLTGLLLGGCKVIKSLGRNPSGEALSVIEQQPNYRNGQFENPGTKDSVHVGLHNLFKKRPGNSRPNYSLPVVKTDLVNTRYTAPTVIWFGHSSFLLKSRTANILVDPVFNSYAGPIAGIITAFDGTNAYSVKDLPIIDVLIISHDHYDHLDYKTIKSLKSKVKMVVVPQGVGAHFRYWGYDPQIIHEVNWGEAVRVNPELTVTATMARHTSQRSFSARKTLWASYVILADGYRIFYSGDGGYGIHFKNISRQYGPFDLALMECGQYDHDWPNHHMFPNQTAQAAADLGAKLVIPIHWGKFAEAYHAWNAPVKQLITAADRLEVKVCVPKLGEAYTLGDAPLLNHWWE